MADNGKLAREMAAGRCWRAKEILQGRLRSAGYDAEQFEQYGGVLLHLGDVAEAGKYLFLSGSRKPEYGEAIGVYLGRHAKSINSLYGTFPAGVRSAAVSAYPERVRADLEAAGFSPSRLQRLRQPEHGVESTWRDKAFLFCVVSFFLLLILGFVIQSFRGLGWLVERISGA